jgi:hypothetical protein
MIIINSVEPVPHSGYIAQLVVDGTPISCQFRVVEDGEIRGISLVDSGKVELSKILASGLGKSLVHHLLLVADGKSTAFPINCEA